ncbi:MAG: phosphoglucosamine mutase, partial [Bacteroidota bacterium]
KIPRSPSLDLEAAFVRLIEKFPEAQPNQVDGLKMDFPEGWVHLRKSNTEPIIRVYAEAKSVEAAKALVDKVKQELVG